MASPGEGYVTVSSRFSVPYVETTATPRGSVRSSGFPFASSFRCQWSAPTSVAGLAGPSAAPSGTASRLRIRACASRCCHSSVRRLSASYVYVVRFPFASCFAARFDGRFAPASRHPRGGFSYWGCQRARGRCFGRAVYRPDAWRTQDSAVLRETGPPFGRSLCSSELLSVRVLGSLPKPQSNTPAGFRISRGAGRVRGSAGGSAIHYSRSGSGFRVRREVPVRVLLRGEVRRTFRARLATSARRVQLLGMSESARPVLRSSSVPPGRVADSGFRGPARNGSALRGCCRAVAMLPSRTAPGETTDRLGRSEGRALAPVRPIRLPSGRRR